MNSCKGCGNEFTTRKQKVFCSNACQQESKYKRYITEWLAGIASGEKYIGEVSNHVRRWLHERSGSQCEHCGWSKVNEFTGKIPLTVNHIDGNWSNHQVSNLELICGACHSLTSNYGSLNRGKGRTNRR